MPIVRLSTGPALRSEDIERAEFYPEDAFAGYGCHFGGPEMRNSPFLSIQTNSSVERIDGLPAAVDADILERAGVRVVRHPGKNK